MQDRISSNLAIVKLKVFESMIPLPLLTAVEPLNRAISIYNVGLKFTFLRFSWENYLLIPTNFKLKQSHIFLCKMTL
jgi:hypothetical protein